MAILIENRSKCPICGKIITSQEDYILIPPLISNTKDPLFLLSDVCLHKRCLNRSNHKQKLMKHLSIFNERIPPSKLKCIVDGLTISKPEKQIAIGLLTSNEDEELYRYNYININKDNVCKWNQKDDFISTVKHYLEEDKWTPSSDFNYLEYILNEVKNCI